MTQNIPHPNHRFDSLTINRLGLWLFIVSDASFFLALLSSRFFVVGTSRPDDIIQPLGLFLTVILLISSLTAYRAEAAARHDNRQGVTNNLILTMVLGVVFLCGVGYEWMEAFQHPALWPSSAYGTVLFTLTGVHATHVLTGVLALLFVYFRTRNADSVAQNQWAVEGAVKWWHFVDVAWVFIYPVLYLVG